MKENKLFQVGTLNSLMMGDYHGSVSVKDLLKEGNVGIGTYDGLDGEAIIVNGKAYDGRADGKVYEMNDNDTLPFSTVSHFDETVEENNISFSSIEEFKQKMEAYLPSHNFFYMIKMEGTFNVRVRSCFKQKEPYEPLYKVACDQREFQYEDVDGYVIGVYCPNYIEGMNLPGWHIHFLSKDFSKGGHILKVDGNNIKFKINQLNGWNVYLPHTEGFSNWDLTEDLKEKTKAVEGSSKK